ncbi:hypothetical protein B0H65DRAFT_249744 [Neurospora tetraspora]|uniref:Uncharacterized protein n=1 Tax=Neurospora tetraspora TaxID=94610 RepID=A0AAE0MP00_9PEZI|nr:hypothetical protein B0H65DRAFT_249744 [Neurospora tetraspora]
MNSLLRLLPTSRLGIWSLLRSPTQPENLMNYSYTHAPNKTIEQDNRTRHSNNTPLQRASLRVCSYSCIVQLPNKRCLPTSMYLICTAVKTTTTTTTTRTTSKPPDPVMSHLPYPRTTNLVDINVVERHVRTFFWFGVHFNQLTHPLHSSLRRKRPRPMTTTTTTQRRSYQQQKQRKKKASQQDKTQHIKRTTAACPLSFFLMIHFTFFLSFSAAEFQASLSRPLSFPFQLQVYSFKSQPCFESLLPLTVSFQSLPSTTPSSSPHSVCLFAFFFFLSSWVFSCHFALPLKSPLLQGRYRRSHLCFHPSPPCLPSVGLLFRLRFRLRLLWRQVSLAPQSHRPDPQLQTPRS